AIHLTAIIQAPYHIYSQNSPEGVTLPTKILFNRNPLLSVQGACQEEGKLEQSIVEGLRLSYYEKRVSFIQLVKLKANVKTKISGKIEFMACTNTHCLPPKVQPFLITLNEPK
ncbi:MAG TPA: hypothetical protein VFS31_02285, partial [Chitinophagaceae bacterium]|nr:hypothetical protein [Chitinophagaceae bacterium]